MRIRIFQKGFNFSQDGPGNRLVYHLQGCNMHCPWCANPEGISCDFTMMADKARLFPAACPYGAIRADGLDRRVCEGCAGRECLMGGDFGVRLSGRELTTDELLTEALQSVPLFFGGGGVTLTGGEPTLQFQAVRELLEKLKAHGIHTALETNGTHRQLPALFALIDQLMMDFKHYDAAIHKEVTGVGNEGTKENILAARKAEKSLLLRIPLVNGFNAAPKDLEGFADFFRQVNWPGLSVELLRYHEFGKDKWEKCGMVYEMRDGYVSTECLRLFEKGLSEAGVSLVRT